MELYLAIIFLKSWHRSMKSVAEVKEEPPGPLPAVPWLPRHWSKPRFSYTKWRGWLLLIWLFL